jgi:hypothetical protein
MRSEVALENGWDRLTEALHDKYVTPSGKIRLLS